MNNTVPHYDLNEFVSLLQKYSVEVVYSSNGYHLTGKYENYTLLNCGIADNKVFGVQMSYNIYFRNQNIVLDGNYFPSTLDNIETHIKKLIKKFKDIRINLRIKNLNEDFK